MNVFTLIFAVFLVLMGALTYLWYLAQQGSTGALTVLITLGVLLVFATFKALEILSDWLRDRAENQRFKANTTENLEILHSAFKTQNQALIGAARETRLLTPGGQKPTIDLPMGMFEQVEEQ